MNTRSKLGVLALAAAFALPAASIAQDSQTAKAQGQTEAKPVNIISSLNGGQARPEKKQGKEKLRPEKKQQAADLLKLKSDEMKELQAKATNVTLAMGKLASSGKLAQDAESLKTMQQLVDELKSIRERLDKMQEEISDIQGWIEGQNENLPIMQNDISDLKRNKFSNYVQFQYQDTDRIGGANDAFRLRRVRLGLTETIDPKTTLKVSFDLATGTNQTQAQLKDAFLSYAITPSDVAEGTTAIGGQMPLPLGYELERSSSEREFPERAMYNQIMFNGERDRGVQLRHGLGQNALAHIGLFNSLTITDPEQANLAPGTENRLVGTAGLRYYTNKLELGVSGLVGKRPKYTANSATSPEVDRKFIYLDATYIGLFDPKLFVRAEAMIGKDRVPNATAAANRTAHDMSGYQLHLGYNLDGRNQINFRYEQFDPNKDNHGDLVRGYGAAYQYFFNPNAKLVLAHEIFVDDARAVLGTAPNTFAQRRYQQTTLRVQFKF